MNEEDEKGLLDPRSGFRTTLGLGVELVGNTGLDFFSFVPGSQQAGSALLNVLAQKIRGGKFSKGEVLAAAATSQIPGLSQAKAITKAGKILRGSAKGGITGGITTTSMTAVDEGRAPTIGEFATGVGSGAVLGGMFETAANTKQVQQFVKDLGTAIDRSGITMPLKIARGELIGDLTGGTFSTPKGAAFDDNTLKKYIDDALAYRKARLEEKTVQGFSPKRVDLMKGFGRTVRNKSGQEFILVRRKKVPNPDVREAVENYQLRSLWSVEDQLVKKRGFEFNRTPEVAELNKLKVELNKFKNQHGDRYYAALMEQGERAYLEHKVARGQSWFWNRIENKKAGETFGDWVEATNRNNIENLRLLFREPYKQIKDTTEMRLAARQAGIKNDYEKLVIDIEDPLSGDIFKRSNPGNLLIRRADNGQVVGLIGDFYQELYSESFKKNYSLKLLRSKGVPKKYRAKPGETLKQYQARIFNEKLDEAFAQGLTYEQLKEQSLDEMAEFFDTFDEQLGMIDTPQWVKNIQRGRFDDPYGQEAVRRNVEDLKAIQARKEIDNSLLKMVEDVEVSEKTAGKFGVYTDMEDPNLFEAAQKILEDFRAKTPKGEQGVIGEIGEERARSRLMKILFDKYGAK